MDHEKIRNQQSKILNLIEVSSETNEANNSRLFQILADCDKEKIKRSIGNFGVKLLGFSQEVDHTHPDLFHLYDSAFADGSSFSDAVLDLIKLSENSTDISQFVADNLCKVITKHPQFKMLSRVIDAPSKNFSHSRFVKSDMRSQLRSVKKQSKVDLRVLRTKGSNCWEDSPEDFSSYARFFNRLLPLIEEATRQHEHFASFGLTSMASEIEGQLMKIMAEAKDEKYYGFNRITMTSAAVILAHMLNATFEFSSTTSPAPSWRRSALRIQIFSDQFKDNRAFSNQHSFDYEPLVIPVHEMKRVPGEMVSLIQKLDNWPEASGFPIFDNFWVMLPKIRPEEIMYDLLEEGRLAGALLGEKDGEIYFVSYWM